MADYKRLISYMYLYEKGTKKKNIGYTRIEVRAGECKFTIHMQLIGVVDSIFPTYLIKRKADGIDLVYLGDSVLKNQVVDSKFISQEKNVMGSEYRLGELSGLVMFYNDEVFYGTEWDDKPILLYDLLDALKQKSLKYIRQEKIIKAAPVLYGDGPSDNRVYSNQIKKVIPKTISSQIHPSENLKIEIVGIHNEEKLEEDNMAIKEQKIQYQRPKGWKAIETEMKQEENRNPWSLYGVNEHHHKENEAIYGSDTAYKLEKQNNRLKVTRHEATGREYIDKISRNENILHRVTENNIKTQEYTPSYKTHMEHDNSWSLGNYTTNETMVKATEVGIEPNIKEMDHILHSWDDETESVDVSFMLKEFAKIDDQMSSSYDKDHLGPADVEKDNNEFTMERAAPQYIKEFEEANSGLLRSEEEVIQEQKITTGEQIKTSDLLEKEESKIAHKFFQHYPRITPFEDNEITMCVRIEPKDIKEFPEEAWVLNQNSFLMHGYYCYNHLIFAKMNHRCSMKYVIGVPGIFHNRERFMAKMFGFESFKTIRKRELRQGDFGYWLMEITI